MIDLPMRARLAARLCAICLAVPGAVRAERLPIRTYARADGLPSDRVRRAVRDSRGFLWFLTREGLSRFDGTRFVNYDERRGLPSADVRDLLEARDGTLWVATVRGLASLAAGRGQQAGQEPLFAALAVGAGDGNAVLTLLQDQAGRIWVGTAAGLALLEKGASGTLIPKRVPLEVEGQDPPSIFALALDAHGCLWLGTEAGLLRRCEGFALERYPIASPGADDRVFGVQLDSAGRVWAGHVELGAFGLFPTPPGVRVVAQEVTLVAAAARLAPALGPDGRVRLPAAPGEVQRLTSAEGLAHDWVRNGLSKTADGSIWFGTVNGLTQLDGDRLRTFGLVQGLVADSVGPPTEDLAKNLWIGTANSGVMRLARGGATSFDARDGLGADSAISVFLGRAGELYATTRVAQKLWFSRHEGERFTAVPIKNFGWGWGQIGFQDHLGGWWMPSGDGLFHYGPTDRLEELEGRSAIAHYRVRDGLAGRDVFRLFEDAGGDVWASSYSPIGLTRWQRADGTLRRYGAPEGIPTSAVASAFGEDGQGGLWVGFEDGTVWRRRRAEERFAPISLPPARTPGMPGMIEAIYLDHAGRLWIASDHAGVLRVEDPGALAPRALRITTENGLSSNDVTCVVEDSAGLVYLGTFAGVDRLDSRTGVLRHYGVADGLANNGVRAAVRDRQGALWFATEKGVSRLWPEPDASSALQPARLTSLHIDGLASLLPEMGQQQLPSLILSPEQNRLDLEFLSVDFTPGQVLRYQARLGGAAEEWSAPSPERAIHYAHLAAGDYQFQVRAVAADGRVSEPAGFAFSVVRPFWQRPWFVLLAAGAAFAAIALGWRLRLGRLLEAERVRTRIALDLHDDVGSSLSRIAILSEVAALQSAEGRDVAIRLAEISETAREVIGTASDLVWSTDPRRDDLGSLLSRLRTFASGLFDHRQILWQFEVPEDAEEIKLAPEQRRHLYLILKEALHNAARHSGARNIEVAVAREDGHLRAWVNDDGLGCVLPAPSAEAGGNGLRNMSARAREAGGSLQIDSAPREGTRVSLRIPLRSR